jgi:hypothetical protein
MEPAEPFESIHDAYLACGPEKYYRDLGHAYRNPHESIIADLIDQIVPTWPIDCSYVLDLAAGSGEVTLQLLKHDPAMQIDAIDPYTFPAYEHRTGRTCQRLNFQELASGALREKSYSLVVCSFALHLVEPSRLPGLCWELSQIAPRLLILTPHKRPELRPDFGWQLTHQIIHHRVRARLYSRR